MFNSAFAHERDRFGCYLAHLYGRKVLSDTFKKKMLYDNPVRFQCFSEGDIAAPRNARTQ
ncbi:MAG TPA: hypothetical protein VIB79_01245 [Candidatus Binatia bacterium]